MENKFYIPFETAKLLKDKGFPQENEWFYVDNGKGITVSLDGEHCTDKDGISRPTYFEVIDWFDQKRINILINKKAGKFVFNIHVSAEGYNDRKDINWYDFYYKGTNKKYNTRIEAINAAIKKAITIL